mgnify:CR=1 FL=1
MLTVQNSMGLSLQRKFLIGCRGQQRCSAQTNGKNKGTLAAPRVLLSRRGGKVLAAQKSA